MSKTDTAALIDLVVDRAAKLREAGVLKFAHDGMSVELRSLEPDTGEPVKVEDEEPRSAWDDPALFGRKPGSPVPGGVRKENK